MIFVLQPQPLGSASSVSLALPTASPAASPPTTTTAAAAAAAIASPLASASKSPLVPLGTSPPVSSSSGVLAGNDPHAAVQSAPPLEGSPVRDPLSSHTPPPITPSKSGNLSSGQKPRMSSGEWTSISQKKKPPTLDSKKNDDFHKIFKEIPEAEVLADGVVSLCSSRSLPRSTHPLAGFRA